MVNEDFKFQIKAVEDVDREWIKDFIKKRWGSQQIVYNGKIFYPHKLNGFIIKEKEKIIGLITYKKYKNYLQIITINSLVEKKGLGVN